MRNIGRDGHGTERAPQTATSESRTINKSIKNKGKELWKRVKLVGVVYID